MATEPPGGPPLTAGIRSLGLLEAYCYIQRKLRPLNLKSLRFRTKANL